MPNGVMNRQLGMSFISDTRLPSTFAHEGGHFVADMGHDGTDTKLLMRGDGSGYQIRFALAKRFRSRSPSDSQSRWSSVSTSEALEAEQQCC
jgi:hypothetical protein